MQVSPDELYVAGLAEETFTRVGFNQIPDKSLVARDSGSPRGENILLGNTPV